MQYSKNNDEMRGREYSARIVKEYFIRHPSLHPIHARELIREILDNEPKMQYNLYMKSDDIVIGHDDQCENSRGWVGFPCECEERFKDK